jgi:hypothetical protein
MNAASSLQIQLQSGKGSKTNLLRIGQPVRLYLGLGGLLNLPRFYGYVANPAFKSDPGIESAGFECFDYLAAGGKENSVQLTPTVVNYDGWDASMAIRDVVEGIYSSPVDAPGCVGTDPKIVITPDSGLYFPNYTDRLTLIQAINEFCFDDQYPDLPVPYRFWQDGEGHVHHRKVQPLSTSYPRAIINYDSGIHSTDIRVRSSKLATGAVVTGAKDKDSITERNYQAVYSEASHIASKGFWQRKISKPNLQSDDECQSWAKRVVALYRNLYIAKEVIVREPLYLWPGDVVSLHDVTTGRAENIRVTQLEISFGPGKLEQRLMLGNFTYMPREYIVS